MMLVSDLGEWFRNSNGFPKDSFWDAFNPIIPFMLKSDNTFYFLQHFDGRIQNYLNIKIKILMSFSSFQIYVGKDEYASIEEAPFGASRRLPPGG